MHNRTARHRLATLLFPGAPERPDCRGTAMLLVIVGVTAATIIGAAYLASIDNAPQISDNMNSGIKARYIADSGADLAAAIMECETFDWRTAHSNGVLVDNFSIGGGSVTITVKDLAGGNPDSTCEYPVVVTEGAAGRMKQLVGMQLHTPRNDIIADTVDVDLSEFAAFGAASIDVVSGWIARWPASPMSHIGLPVKVGTNATTAGALRIANSSSAPDAIGYVMSTAAAGTITDAVNGPAPIRRENFSTNETVLLPAPPPVNFSNILWGSPTGPNLTSDTNINLTGDRRYYSFVARRSIVNLDLGGATRTVGVSGTMTVENGAVLRVNNGHLNLVVQGLFGVYQGSAIELGPGGSISIYAGGAVSIQNSVVGLPASVAAATRDARVGLSEYYDPSRCTLYCIKSINSVDLNLLDGDNAAAWVWSDNTVKSWLIYDRSYVCGRIYAHTKTSLSIDTLAAVFGSVTATNIVLGNGGAIYYDHCLDDRTGYTNPDSALYAGPMDLRDDIRLLLTDLSSGTLNAILALLAGPAPAPVAIDPFAPTPRDKERVAARWWKRYGLRINRDRTTAVDDIIDGP